MITSESLKEILRDFSVHKYSTDWEKLVENLMSEFEKSSMKVILFVRENLNWSKRQLNL